MHAHYYCQCLGNCNLGLAAVPTASCWLIDLVVHKLRVAKLVAER